MTLKKITIILVILGGTIYVSLSTSMHSQAKQTIKDDQVTGIGSETLNMDSSDTLKGETGENLHPSNISSQDRARMLASAVQFRYDFCTGYNAMQAGLGTKLDPHTVLTHNHFGNQAKFCMINLAVPDHSHDIAIKVDSRAMGHGDEYGDQTLLVYTTEEIKGSNAALASQQMMSEMVVGEFVEVVYWEEEIAELAIASFQIRGFLEDSVLVLDDPDDIINKGDSGGGVFYQSALIGNTWRYLLTLDQDNLIIDKQIHVQLLPKGIGTP